VDEILTLEDGRGHVQLEFKDLKSSTTFTAVVRMRVANNLPNGTIINGFMGFGWKDEQIPDGHEEKAPGKKIKSNSVGKVWITLDTSGLDPGSYQLIIEGQRSQLKAIPTLVIDPPTEG